MIDLIQITKEDYDNSIKLISSLPLDKSKAKSIYPKALYQLFDKAITYHINLKPYKDDIRLPLSLKAYNSFKTLSQIAVKKFSDKYFQTYLYLFPILNFKDVDTFYNVIKELEEKGYIEFFTTDNGLRLICYDNEAIQENIGFYTKQEEYLKAQPKKKDTSHCKKNHKRKYSDKKEKQFYKDWLNSGLSIRGYAKELKIDHSLLTNIIKRQKLKENNNEI